MAACVTVIDEGAAAASWSACGGTEVRPFPDHIRAHEVTVAPPAATGVAQGVFYTVSPAGTPSTGVASLGDVPYRLPGARGVAGGRG